MEAADTSEVLAETEKLRRRARGDRRASSVPLITFGAIILLSAPFYYVPFGPLWRSDQLYWVLALPVGFAAIALWYRYRRTRTGIGPGRGTYSAAAFGTALTALPGLGLIWVYAGPLTTIGLALLALTLLQRNGYLAVCAAALGITGWMVNSHMLIGRLNDTVEQIVGRPSHDGFIYWVEPLFYVLLGLVVLTAGLVALHHERDA
ncbi:hypothetical protein [Streptomyces sp. 8N616]|uniref:hypothetical protein n=1 Tax=Streptomyces sp. 8N616 TaxID=3457414 RepID=UPI003FD57044